MLIIPLLFLISLTICESSSPCRSKYFESDSFVCVCNEEHCDFLKELPPAAEGHFDAVSSSRDGLRFSLSEGVESVEKMNGFADIIIDYNKLNQEIVGFGGSFTDATGITFNSLTAKVQRSFMRSYFSPDGLSYNLARVPIAGCDFSTHPYSYDDVLDDVTLKHFSLTKEDFDLKIPLIHEGSALADNKLLLLASPWAPPAWMKTNGKVNGTGSLKKEFYDVYARYITKFIKAYHKEGIPIWGITLQNEPLTGLKGYNEKGRWNSCGWTPEEARDWLKYNLAPNLKKEDVDCKILIYDSNRVNLPWYVDAILADEEAAASVNGIALHWYEDDKVGPEILAQVKKRHPSQFLLATEACVDPFAPMDQRVILGSWARAEFYVHGIIQNSNHFVAGFIDWNLALNLEGGPNWVGNFVDAAIIINEDENEFYKQPIFYAMGHFSKFIPRGSVALSSSASVDEEGIISAAFSTPDEAIVIVLLNRNEEEKKIRIQTERKTFVHFVLNRRSISTIRFKGERKMAQKLSKTEL